MRRVIVGSLSGVLLLAFSHGVWAAEPFPGINSDNAAPSVGGVPVLPGIIMKPKEGGGTGGGSGETGQKKTPKFRTGKALKDTVNLEGTPTRLQSCGTHWTGWIDDPGSAINPCPEGCVRGEATLTKTYKGSDKMLYDIRYQCYFENQAVNAPAGAGKKLKAGELAPGSVPVGAVTPASGPWHTLVSVTGDKFNNATGARVLWYPKDDDSMELAGSVSATLRRRIGQDGIEIEMPRDAGGAQGGVVRVMVSLPGVPEPVFAGRFTVKDLAAARADLRKKAGVDLLSSKAPAAPVTPQLDPSQRPGAGPGGLTPGNAAKPTGGAAASGGETGAATPPLMAGGRGAGIEGRELSTKNMDAPGPSISEVRPKPPMSVKVAWTKVDGATGYIVHAVERGGNQPISGSELMGSGAGGAMSYILDGLTPGFDYSVWVQARYPDGKTGASELKSITMPSPANPTGFTATAAEADSVSLSWDPSEGAAYYWVEGPNLPRQQTTATTVTVTNLPDGTHEWLLMAAYGGGVYNSQTPSRATATIKYRDAMVARAFDAGQARYPSYGPDPALWKRLASSTDMGYDQLVSSFEAIWAVSNAYKHILDRDANLDEARNYIAQSNGGRTWQAIWRELAQSPERDQRFGHWAPAPFDSPGEARAAFQQPTLRNAESCFGGVGDRCDTDFVADPVWQNGFTMPDGTLMANVVANVVVGSILHDNACLKDGNGLHCDGQFWHWAVDLNPSMALAKAATSASFEWNKAVWNMVDGRKWREVFGPYPVDKDLRRNKWYDDLRPAQSREAWMAPVAGVLTIPVHTERYRGSETRRSRALSADPGISLDYRDGQFCRAQGFRTTGSMIGKADWGVCR